MSSYDAVREALPALAVLLTSDSPELRAETANLFAWFPESVMALAETPEATTLRAVEAMLVGLADCTGVERYYDRYYTAHRLFTLVFPGKPAEAPQSFGDLSDVQQRVVRFIADQDADGWPAGGMDALRRWKVPTGHSDLRAYVGGVQAG